MSGASQLPQNWALAKVGDICLDLQYGYTESASAEPCGPRFLRITDIQDGSVNWPSVPYCSIRPELIEKYALRGGDIVFARTGGTVGKSFIITSVPEPAVFASYLIRLSPHSEIVPSYLYYFFQSLAYWEQIGLKKGGLQGNVNATTLSSLELPLCSRNEQLRIVAKIEELFSELDKGVESLTTAREQLKAYRQAVLKHAFEGKLTASWRSDNAAKLPNADSIRLELSTARRECWRDQAAFRRATYVEPQSFDREDVPDSPDAWAIMSMDELCHHITSGSRDWSRFYDRGSSVFIMAQNVRPGRYDVSTRQLVDPPADNAEAHRTRVRQDDLLVTIVGANTGDVCLFPFESEDHYVCQSVALMRLVKSEYAKYLNFYFQAHYGGLRQYRRYIYGAGRPHLSFEQLRQTVVPLPSVAEAAELVARLESILSSCDHQLSLINTEMRRSDSLRESILSKAFCGQLVRQDAADEPASVLLNRIKADRMDHPPSRRRNKNGKKEAA